MNRDVFTGEWYPWYPERALTSEGIDGLTLTEEGAYRRALDKAWLKGSIPSDPKDAAKVIGKGCSVKIAARILELFTPVQGNRKRSVNLPQERYRAEQAEKHRKAVERAVNAANARHSKNAGADATSRPQATVKDAIKNKSIEEEKEEGRGGRPFSHELLVSLTESTLSTVLNLETKTTLADVVPEGLLNDWIGYAKSRLLTLDKKYRNRDGINRTIGYWLTDFKRDHKRDYERIEKAPPRLQTAAEKAAADEEFRRTHPVKRPPVSGMPPTGLADTNTRNGDRPA